MMYLFWRYLHCKPSEYEDLPYWEKRLGMEGLSTEQPWITLPGTMEKAYNPFSGRGEDAFKSEFLPEIDPVDNVPTAREDLEAWGLKVTRED